MKKLFGTIAATIALSVSMNAAASLTDKQLQGIEKDVEGMAEIMALSQEQQSELLDAMVDMRERNAEVSAEFGAKSPEFREARKTNRKAYRSTFNEITTEEQREALKASM